jgi:hypothetical protein
MDNTPMYYIQQEHKNNEVRASIPIQHKDKSSVKNNAARVYSY